MSQGAAQSKTDTDRIETLRQCQILNTAPESAFDDLTALAADTCETPVAWIGFLDRDREWVKSRLGFDATELPGANGFCDHALRQPDLFVVADLAGDKRFTQHPLVTGKPHLRFCAALPLITADGHCLGILAVGAPGARELSHRQKKALRVFARQAVLEVELRRLTSTGKSPAVTADNYRDLKATADVALSALRESEARFQAFTDNQPSTAWMKDAEGRYIYVNQTLERVYSITRDAILGKTDFDVLPEETARKLHEHDCLIRESSEARELIEEIPDAKGFVRTWQIWKFPFRDLKGRSFVGGLGFDITARKQAEDAQRATEEKYRSLVEGARDAIFAISEKGTLTSINKGAETITGWPREAWIGKDFAPLVHPDETATASGLMQRVLAGETPPPFDLRIRTRDGDFVPMEFTITPEWLGESVTGILGIGRDVRLRRHLEEQLRQMQKLDSIGRLAAGIAHDFNNILTVQQGYLALLLASDLPAAEKKLLQQVDIAAERAANLTRQLVMFSRKQMIQPKALDLNEVIRQLSKMLERILGEDVILRVHPQRPLLTVQADPGMMEQVLMNLSVNARDAMPNGGSLTITTATIRLDEGKARANPEARPGVFVCLTVADTGSGVPPETLRHLFEPFFTTKEIGKGTGLGLATVHGIVKQHQGWIETESIQERGTVFRIFLPATTSDPAGLAPAPAADASCDSETIFVVEDEPAVRDMVRLLLEQFGYTVITCPSGAQACLIWPDIAAQVDLLLTDMVMPGGVSGRQLAEKLLRNKPSLKVIFTSGYSADLVSDNFSGEEGFTFLQKPYSPKVLAETVRTCLGRTGLAQS